MQNPPARVLAIRLLLLFAGAGLSSAGKLVVAVEEKDQATWEAVQRSVEDQARELGWQATGDGVREWRIRARE